MDKNWFSVSLLLTSNNNVDVVDARDNAVVRRVCKPYCFLVRANILFDGKDTFIDALCWCVSRPTYVMFQSIVPSVGVLILHPNNLSCCVHASNRSYLSICVLVSIPPKASMCRRSLVLAYFFLSCS